MYTKLREAEEQGFFAGFFKIDDGFGAVTLGVHFCYHPKTKLWMLYAHTRLQVRCVARYKVGGRNVISGFFGGRGNQGALFLQHFIKSTLPVAVLEVQESRLNLIDKAAF